MSLDAEVLFGNFSVVSAPSRTKVLQMAGCSPCNVSENGDFNLGCGSYPVAIILQK